VKKEDLLEILSHYPVILKYLESVGKQRLKTTHPEDLNERDDNTPMSLRLQQELENYRKARDHSENMFGLDSP